MTGKNIKLIVLGVVIVVALITGTSADWDALLTQMMGQ